MPRSHTRRRNLDKKRAAKARAQRAPSKRRRDNESGGIDPMFRPPGQRPGDMPR